MTTKTEGMEAAIRSAVHDGPRHADDPEFMAAWETLGFQYSESNIDKVHIGWLMAHYWRDKAIAAANRLRSLSGEGLDDK